jgi:DNA-binding NarL/FixJ family response regulator
VDDDESVLSGLSVILEAHEFEVTIASSVNEALKHIANLSFDVLLSDLHMPGAGDGLIVAGAMRHANPRAITLVLSGNPDMAKATRAMLRMVDEVLLKPVQAGPIVETIQRRLAEEAEFPRPAAVEEEPLRLRSVELAATLLEHERSAITQAWLAKMNEAGSLGALTDEEKTEHLPGALAEIVYRLRYAQPLGVMTLFSMASLQHGARRRRQGLASPVLVEEARALQVALFQTVLGNSGRIDLGQLPATLMAIADEVNAQLLQSLAGYEKEKPAPFTEAD